MGLVNGWNGTDPTGTNPTITVNQGDTVSIILTSGDITHQFAVDWDHDGANVNGVCSGVDNCSSVFGPGPSTTFPFTANFAPGNYTYFCTFHVTMVGTLEVKATSPLPVTITGVSPNPAYTGTPVTLTYTIVNPTTLTGLSVDWGDGTTPDLLTASARADTHTFARAGSFTIIITATDNSGSSGQLSTSPFVVDSPSTPTAPAAILGLTPIEFYSLIGVIAAIIAIATILGFRRARKP